MHPDASATSSAIDRIGPAAVGARRERGTSPGLAESLRDWNRRERVAPDASRRTLTIGLLPGEGVGPEVIGATLDVLRAVAELRDLQLDLRTEGPIGAEAEAKHGRSLTPAVERFCESIFADGGAILCGPGGNRFVYDLRRRFDLYCKFTPIQPLRALEDAGPVRGEAREGVDLIVVRENTGGVYFGQGERRIEPGRGEIARCTFGYERREVERIVATAADLARRRRGRLCMALKPNGVPAISRLWMDVLDEQCAESPLEACVLEIDNALYQLVAAARAFDVVVAPNMFGDLLSDAAALLLGSRGMSFSGNFGPNGRSVFQTGHGSAHDLAGRDLANPIGQIHSAAMMLREAFGESAAADAIHRAVIEVLESGVRTPDIAGPGSRRVGTRDMGRAIAERIRRTASS